MLKKKLNIYNHTGATEADNKTILKAYDKIELTIYESGRVWNEGGEYIADAIGCK